MRLNPVNCAKQQSRTTSKIVLYIRLSLGSSNFSRLFDSHTPIQSRNRGHKNWPLHNLRPSKFRWSVFWHVLNCTKQSLERFLSYWRRRNRRLRWNGKRETALPLSFGEHVGKITNASGYYGYNNSDNSGLKQKRLPRPPLVVDTVRLLQKVIGVESEMKPLRLPVVIEQCQSTLTEYWWRNTLRV